MVLCVSLMIQEQPDALSYTGEEQHNALCFTGDPRTVQCFVFHW